MSQNRLKDKEKRYDFQILEYLAINGETSQTDLPTFLDCSYRTVLRETSVLQTAGLIKKGEPRRVSQHGPPQMVWGITLIGVLGIIGSFRGETFEKVIENNRDLSVFFKEWDYLKSNELVKNWSESVLISYSDDVSIYNNLIKKKPLINETIKFMTELKYFERQLAYKMLAIEPVINGALIIGGETSRIFTIFDHFMKNETFQNMIFGFFKEVENNYKATIAVLDFYGLNREIK